MKKTLTYITLSGILATIVLIIQSIIMPYVFAASETAGVKAKLDLLSDCTWSDGEGSALTVETGKLCEINGTGKTATTVTVQTGGTLLVGNFLTTDFTVTGTATYNTTIYGTMDNAGTFATTGGGVLVDGGTLTSSNAMSIGGSGNAKVLELRDGSTLTTSGSGNIVIWGDMTVYDDSTWTNSSPNMILRRSLTMQKSATANSPDLINNTPGVITLKAASSGDYLYNDLNLYDDSTIKNNETATIEVMSDVILGNSDADAAEIINDGNFYIGWDGSSTGTSDNTLRIRYNGAFTNQDDGILIVDKNGTTPGDGRVMIYPNYDGASNTPQLLNYGSIEVTTMYIGDVINRLSEFHNYSGGSFRSYYSGSFAFEMHNNATIENDSGSVLFQVDGYVWMTGSASGSAIINNNDSFYAKAMYITDYSTVKNYSTMDIAPNPVDAGYLYMSGTSAQLTNYTGGTLNVYGIQVGAYTGTGATLTTEHNSQVSATTLSAIDPGIVDAAGQIDITEKLFINQGGTVTFKDPYSVESDIYEIGSLEIESPTSKTSTFTIGDSTTPYVRINGNYGYGGDCAGGSGYCSIEMGYDASGGGSSELNINGTLNVVDTAQNGNIEIGKYGVLNLADDKTLDVNETGGTFYIRGDVVDNGTANLDGTTDLEMPLNVSGILNVDTTDITDATLNMVNSYTVGSTGTVDQGLTSTVTVEGSTTTISGDYTLDGILNSGDLTVTSTGWVTSGVGTSTNFYINADDLTVDAGGHISSDGVSEVDRPGAAWGAGSYGGQGIQEEGFAADTYGYAKETTTPVYGMSAEYSGTKIANGGGGVKIFSDGNITINGTISANGANGQEEYDNADGSGGTVIIIHDPTAPGAYFFTGSGTISANGGGSSVSMGGGGGRIIIDSKLLDEPDLGHYDFGEATAGTIQANGGECYWGGYAAAGTIAYLGDGNNADDTLIIDQNSRTVQEGYLTGIAEAETFDRVEVRESAIADLTGITLGTPGVCYKVSSTETNSSICGTSASKPDKPDTLYINNSVVGAGTGTEPGLYTSPAKGDGVDDTVLSVGDLTPVFSAMYKNPTSTTKAAANIKIQVAEDTDDDGILFESTGGHQDTFMWDYTGAILNRSGGSLVPGVSGNRSADVEYAGTALTAGTTYYVRVAFTDANGTGLWSHADYNNHYKFEINNYLSIAPLCSGGAFSIMDYNHPVSKIMDLAGRRFGEGRCQIDFDPSAYTGTWYVGVGLASNETEQNTAFNTEPDNTGDDIDPIDNTGSGSCHMDDTGNGTAEQYAYNISDFSGSGDTIYTDTETGTDCSGSSFQINHGNPPSGWLYHDLEVNPGENVATGTSTTNHHFYLNLFTSINSATVVDDYTLNITLLASSAP